MNAAKKTINRATLEEIVHSDKKGRYSFSEDGKSIRANQGHSLEIDLRLDKKTPPPELYHGTVWKAVDSIMERGLEKMQRHHVHLSAERSTAVSVGARRGSPVVLVVHAERMNEDGHEFYLSDNGVWLTDHVPAEYIEIDTGKEAEK